MKSLTRSGITATELLVLTVLGALVVAMVLPAIQKARAPIPARSASITCVPSASARRITPRPTTKCYRATPVQPRREVGTRNSCPTSARRNSPSSTRWLATGGDAAEDGNRTVAGVRVPAFVCPAAPHPDRWVLTRDPDDETKSFRASPTDYVGSAGASYENNDPKSLHPGAMHTRTVDRRFALPTSPTANRKRFSLSKWPTNRISGR